MFNNFCGNYTTIEKERYQPLLEDAFELMPSSLIYPVFRYDKFIAAKEYGKAFRSLMDFFELSMQFSAGVMLRYLEKEKVDFDDDLKGTVELMIGKPLSVGDWVQIFRVVAQKSYALKPDHPLINSLQKHIYHAKDGNILNGWGSKKGEEHAGIDNFRNKFIHDTFLDDDQYFTALCILEQRMMKFLLALEPLMDIHFFFVDQVMDVSGEENLYMLLPDKGIDPQRKLAVSTRVDLDVSNYYQSDRPLSRREILVEEQLIRLSPFIIYHFNDELLAEKRYSYIFQTIIGGNLGKANFVSSHEKARKKETELFKEHFADFLHKILGAAFTHSGYKFSLKKDTSLSVLAEKAKSYTNRFINQQIASEKYDTELFVERELLSREYSAFLESPVPAMVILGNTGSGKTNQICSWIGKIPGNDLVLAFYGKDFSSQSIQESLQQIFGDSKRNATEILSSINDKLIKENRKLHVFFDAINECTIYNRQAGGRGPLDLFWEIDLLFVAPAYSNLKVVISCRTFTWEEMVSKSRKISASHYYASAGKPDGNILKGFSPEEFSLAYPKYAKRFELSTSLEQLMGDAYYFIRFRLFDPLILKTSAGIYKGKSLSAELKNFNSTSLFARQFESLEQEQRYLLGIFTEKLWGYSTDALSLSEIYRARDDQQHILHVLSLLLFTGEDMQFSPALFLLLDQGILRIEHGPLLQELRFVYERFHEYLFARTFLEIRRGASINKEPVEAAHYEKVLKEAGSYAVIMGAMRNALIMDYHYCREDASVIIALAKSNLYESEPLIADTLNVLLEESYGECYTLVMQMLHQDRALSIGWATEKERIDRELKKLKKIRSVKPEIKESLAKEKAIVDRAMYPVLKLRKAAVSAIYKIYRSPLYRIYTEMPVNDPNLLLWEIMSDPIPEVRDNASIYIYYIARFNQEIGNEILDHLSGKILDFPMRSVFWGDNLKKLRYFYIEPACRVATFMVIDGLVERRDYAQAERIIGVWKEIVRKYTFNYVGVRLVMPFFKFLMFRQAEVQNEYVNNGMEYQHFWDKVPLDLPGSWSRNEYAALVPYLNPEMANIADHRKMIVKGMCSGDAFSYFLLERILLVHGYTDWKRVGGTINAVLNANISRELRPYMEMSVSYVLFHILHKYDQVIDEAEALFGTLVKRWMIENKGLFRSHYNHLANENRPYKQYPLNWYAAAYCRHYGDGLRKPGDVHAVPVFRELLQLAYTTKDKELLYNCLENIAVLVSDFSCHKTALDLFEFAMGMFKSESAIRGFDAIHLAREGYQKGIRSFLSDVLGTIKSYYPREVDYFILNKLNGSEFPDMEKFREDIYNNSRSHEGIGDMLTHKFGNFVSWGLLNEPVINNFFVRLLQLATESKNYFDWFDISVRYSFTELLGVKNIMPKKRKP